MIEQIRKRKCWFFICFCFLYIPECFCNQYSVWNPIRFVEAAQEDGTPERTEEFLEKHMEDVPFDALQKFLNDLPEESRLSFSFRELLTELIHGNFSGVADRFLKQIQTQLFGTWKRNGTWMGQVLALGLVGAVFANFSCIFADSQIAETGFYVTCLFLFVCLVSGFLSAVSITETILKHLFEFMRMLLPVYLLTASFSGGGLALAGGYSWMLVSISLVEFLFLKVGIPCVRVYLLLTLAGNLVKEEMLSHLTKLLETGIRWGIKTSAGLVLGFHLIQGMVTPYADSLKNTSVQRLLRILPGIGSGVSALSQTILGTGVLIKNTVGAGAVLVLFLISAIPLIRLVFFLLCYQGAAAVLEPICDKRMTECISMVGNGCKLLLYMAAAGIAVFAASLAIVCLSTNVSYYVG